MPTSITGYRVFIASPSGLSAERNAFRNQLAQYNEDEAIQRGVLFIPVGWEDTTGGLGRPQSLINDDVKSSDFFVLLMWDRWGTPPAKPGGKFTSGTQEEFSVALECCAATNRPMRDMLILFKGVGERQLSDPGNDLKQVLDFRRAIEKEKGLLYKTFDTTEEMERILRKHLAEWMRTTEQQRSAAKPIAISIATMSDEEAAPTTSGGRNLEDLINAADDLAQRGSYTDAEVAFSRAVVGDTTAAAVMAYADFLRRRGRLEHSFEMYKRACELAEANSDKATEARALANLGVVDRNRRRYESAEKFLDSARSLCDALVPCNDDLRGYVMGNLAQLYTKKGELNKALALQTEVLSQHQARGSSVDVANSLGTIGVIYRKMERWSEAETAHRNGVVEAEASGVEGLGALALNVGSLGLILHNHEKYHEAIECHTRALDANTKAGRRDSQAQNHGHLAAAYFSLKDWQLAQKHYEECEALNKEFRNTEGIAYIQSAKARYILAEGDAERAASMLAEVVAVYGRIGNTLGEVHNLCFLAEAHAALGHHEQAQYNLKLASRVALNSEGTSLREAVSRVERTLTDKAATEGRNPSER